MTWADVLEEHRRDGIGPMIYGIVRSIVQTATRRYSPAVYANADSWTSEEIDDLLQEFTLEVLLDQGQLDYSMSAGTEVDFRRLIAFQLRRHLAHRRTRTVIDNLLDRAKPILANPPFRVTSQLPLTYELPDPHESDIGPGQADAVLPDAVVRKAAVGALAIPRLAVRSGDREPALYTTENLRRLLVKIARDIGRPFTLGGLDSVLRLVLTPFVGSPLVSIDEVAPATPDLAPEGKALARSAANRLAVQLTPEQGEIFLRKLANESDQDVAAVFGISRPTLAKRKTELHELMAQELSALDDDVATVAIAELSERLIER